MSRDRGARCRLDAFRLARERGVVEGSVDPHRVAARRTTCSPEGPASIAWRIEGTRDAAGRPALGIEMKGAVPLTCQRCLADFEWPIDQRTEVLLARDEREMAALDADSDAEVVLAHGPVDPLDARRGRARAGAAVRAAPSRWRVRQHDDNQESMMAVQQNKKSPAKRGMHRAHDFICEAAAGGGAGERRSALASPHQPERLLPRQEGRQDQSRRVIRLHAAHGRPARVAPLGSAQRRSRVQELAIVTVAIDAMGGDHGPPVTVPAALEFLDVAPDARVVLVGSVGAARSGAREGASRTSASA